MTGWTDADSDDLDRQIQARRQAEQKERRIRKRKPNSGVGSFDYDGSGRGPLTREDVQRRQKADRAMRERADRAMRPKPKTVRRRPWPLPDPKPTTSGRWRARVVHQGRVYIKTFDSRAEAAEFIKQVTSTNKGKE